MIIFKELFGRIFASPNESERYVIARSPLDELLIANHIAHHMDAAGGANAVRLG